MFEIRVYGDQVLRRRAEEVTVFDNELKAFAAAMVETMRAKDGVGLAANQVGVLKRVVVIDPSSGEKDPIIFVNPILKSPSKEKITDEEGCLSLPDIRLKIERHAVVSVEAQDATGTKFTIENADGLLARALQHEIDHLDGLMIIDHISVIRRKLLGGKLKEIAKTARKS